MAFALRDYQENAIAETRISFRDVNGVLLVMATGAGKTIVFCEIAKSAALKGHRTLVLAHRDLLIKQASKKMNEKVSDASA